MPHSNRQTYHPSRKGNKKRGFIRQTLRAGRVGKKTHGEAGRKQKSQLFKLALKIRLISTLKQVKPSTISTA
jgi:hypothetical protein